MKISHLILGMLLLALVCSQAMAISKSDLISHYRTESSIFFEKMKAPDSPTPSPSISPTPQPTTLPMPTFTFSLFPTGALIVTTNPPGTNVYLDETFKGSSPVKITGIAGGIHYLKVKKEGYTDYSTDVIITNGRISSISVRLYTDPWWPQSPPTDAAGDYERPCPNWLCGSSV